MAVPALRLKAGDHEYFLRLDELTARTTRKVRAATGMSLLKAVQAIEEDPDLDLIMTLFYAAAIQADPTTDFEQLEDKLGLTYLSEIVIEEVKDDAAGEA